MNKKILLLIVGLFYFFNQNINAQCTAGALDSDLDGICDMEDLDNDNDGILDEKEKICASTPLDTYTFYGNADSIVQSDLIVFTARGGWHSSYSNEIVKLPLYLSFTVPSSNGYMLGFLPMGGTETIDNWNDGAYKIHLNSSYAYGKFPSPWAISGISYEVGDVFELKIDLDGTLTMLQNESIIYTGIAPVTDYKFTISAGGGILKNVILKQDIQNCAYIDTDGDGQPDYLDLDSDNDGCPDAAEGSAGFTLNDMNGAGALTGGVDNVSTSPTYGVPSLAGAGQEINLSQTADELPRDVSCLCVAANSPQDTDNDGVCDAIDNCPNFDDTLIGTPCNDNDICTENDVWINSCECKGTLTAAACDYSPLMISEIMYHPQELDSLYPKYEDREDAEFLEIWNSGTGSIDVSNYALDGVSYCFPPGTILAPDQRIVLTKDAAVFQHVFGLTPFDVYEGKLSNSGEKIQLFDNQGVELHAVDYSDHHHWSPFADGLGQSIELVSAYGDTEAYYNWIASTHPDGHTAGAANSSNILGSYPGIDSILVDDTQPDPGQAVNITASMVGATSATLEYRVNFGATQSISASVTGGVANFTLPTFAADDIIHYVVKAHNQVGTFSMPRVDDTMPAYAFIVNDPTRPPSNFPILNWYYDSFTPDGEYTTLEYNGVAITNSYSWFRRGKHWRLEFPKGYKFEMPGFSTMPVRDLQLNRPDHAFHWWVNGTMARTTVYTDIISEQGEPKLDAFNMRVDENGEWGKIWTYLTWPNGDWRETVGIDDGHEYYKFPSNEVSGIPNPEIKHPEGGSDAAVWDALIMKDSVGTHLMDMYDIPRMVNFMALSTILCHWDAGTKNFYMHKHPNGRWEGDIWDVDASPRTGIDSIEVDWCLCGEMPRQGVLVRPDGSIYMPDPEGSNSGNTFAKPLLANVPRVKAMYYRRIRTLIDIYFAPGELIGRVLEEANPSDSDIDATANIYANQFAGDGYLNDITETQHNIYVHYPEWQLATYDTLSGFPTSATGITDIVINEIQYAPGGGNQEEFVELYNNTNESIDMSNWELEGLGLTFPYGTVILPNDFLVVASWSPTFISKYGSGKYVAADFDGASLNNSGETLRLLHPDGTVEDEVTYEQAGWKQAHGGASLERISSTAASNDASNWAPSAAPFGTPDAPNNADTAADYPPTFISANIIINEIMYHSDDLNALSDGRLDFIEIRNNETTPVDVSGLQIKGVDYTFPTGTILQPNEIIVIASDIHAFNIKYGFKPFDKYDGKLENNGENLEIIDPSGYVIDSLTFDDKNPWDVAPDGDGYSLELLHPTFDNADFINWFRADNPGGSPGAENTRICNITSDAIVINEINYNSNNGITDPGDWVELYNPNTTPVDISGWTFYDNNNEFIFPSGTIIQPDDYLVLTEDDAMFTSIFPHLTANEFIGNFTFGLSNKGERISLFNENKCLSDYVIFNDKIPWDTIPDGNGPTLSLVTPSYENTLAQSWEASSNINSAYGTPGRENAPCFENIVLLPDPICAGFPAQIKVDSAYNKMDFTWFVSGGTPTNFTVDSESITWNNPGTYNIQLVTKYYECTKVYNQTVTVQDCNTAPMLVDDNFSTNEDNMISGNVLPNDSDPDNDNLTINTIPQSSVTNGTLILNSDGTYDYTPNADFNGTDSFTYEVCDDATSNIATFTPQTLMVEVASGADDVEELSTDGSIDITSSDLDLLEDAPDVYTAIGIRMMNVNIPQGATITNAYLEFVADESQSVATSISISAEAVGNAAPIPTTAYSLSSKTKTNASAAWSNIPVWTTGNIYKTSNISTVIQELISRGDWTSGNAMTLILEGTGRRTAESFDGTAAPKLYINYQILTQNTTSVSLCSTATVTINVAPINDAPIARPDAITTNEDTPKTSNVLGNDNDIDGDNLTVNITPITPPANGLVFFLAGGAYSYTPNADFNGTDTFEYEICDNGTPVMCDTATITVTVIPMNDTPNAVTDTLYVTANSSIQDNVLSNDTDIDNDNLIAMISPMATPINGTVTIQPNGNIDYTPDPNFVGADSFTYEVCDDGTPSMCNVQIVTIIVEPDCVDIQLAAWLEGAFDPALGEMRNTLVASRKLLPGQTPASGLATPTPAGQPYSGAPWNYTGTEGTGWTDANYTGDETDWVLASFRTGTAKNTEVGMAAGLLMKDGSVTFPNRCALLSTVASPLYIVVEHRNHIGVMSPQPVNVIGSTLTYDFRLSDSYRDPTSFGQKQLSTGEWTMYAGDADQSDFPSFDIKGTDKTIWFQNNGIFDYYFSPDFNLDGDINGQDKSLWFENNGISSRVPK